MFQERKLLFISNERFFSKTTLFYTETSDVRRIAYRSDSCSFKTHLPDQNLKHRTKYKPYANFEN